MLGLKITAIDEKCTNGCVSLSYRFELEDVLDVIKGKVEISNWDVWIDDFNGDPNEYQKTIIEQIAGEKVRVGGKELLNIAYHVKQIYESRFLGIFINEKDYWIRILQTGNIWIIQCEDNNILNLFRKCFKQIEEIDEEPITF